MPEFKLIEEILQRSNSQKWNVAKLEWKLIEVIEADEPETCLCGHYPIKELCELKNINNNNIVTVGNCCVKKFMGISSDKIFNAIKNIRKDIIKSINIESLKFLYEKNLLSEWELKFYKNIMNRKKLSEKQKQKKIEINTKILTIIKKRGV